MRVKEALKDVVKVKKGLLELGKKGKVIEELIFNSKLLSFNIQLEVKKERPDQLKIMSDELNEITKKQTTFQNEYSTLLRLNFEQTSVIVENLESLVKRTQEIGSQLGVIFGPWDQEMGQLHKTISKSHSSFQKELRDLELISAHLDKIELEENEKEKSLYRLELLKNDFELFRTQFGSALAEILGASYLKMKSLDLPVVKTKPVFEDFQSEDPSSSEGDLTLSNSVPISKHGASEPLHTLNPQAPYYKEGPEKNKIDKNKQEINSKVKANGLDELNPEGIQIEKSNSPTHSDDLSKPTRALSKLHSKTDGDKKRKSVEEYKKEGLFSGLSNKTNNHGKNQEANKGAPTTATNTEHEHIKNDEDTLDPGPDVQNSSKDFLGEKKAQTHQSSDLIIEKNTSEALGEKGKFLG